MSILIFNRVYQLLVFQLIFQSISQLILQLVFLASSSSTSLLGSSGLSYKYRFTAIVLKSVSLLYSYTLYIFLLILNNLNRLVYLLLCLILPSRHMSMSELRGRLWIVVIDRPFCQFSILLTYFFVLILAISSIAFFMAAACYIIDSTSMLNLFI